jgi:sulfide dehydrogenase cytochrome subunit
MKQEATGFALLACSALVGLSLAGSARAADVATVAEACAGCHGKDGASTESNVPSIAGYSASYIADNMAAYKKNGRPCAETKYRSGEKQGGKTDMCKIAGELSDGDVKGIAKYFSGKKFVRAVQKVDPALTAKGKKVHEEYCEKCHSEGGNVASDDASILAGQWMPYLDSQLNDFLAGKRAAPKAMDAMLKKIDKTDIPALVNYYGSLK